MRKAKEGVVKDMAGNVIEDAKPTYTVQVFYYIICLQYVASNVIEDTKPSQTVQVRTAHALGHVILFLSLSLVRTGSRVAAPEAIAELCCVVTPC